MTHTLLRVVALAGLAVGCGHAERPPPAKPSDAEVRTALALAIGLLETKDYAGYAERFDTPADPAQLLARFRQVRHLPPTFEDGGATAVFDGPTRVVFRKIDGKWYPR